MITAVCPHCNARVPMDDGWQGETIACPDCHKPVVVESAESKGERTPDEELQAQVDELQQKLNDNCLVALGKVVLAVLVLAGFVAVLRIPVLAARHDVEAFDLVLAYLDPHEDDRLYLFRPDKALLDEARAELTGERITAFEVRSVGDRHHEYTYFFQDRAPSIFRTATPCPITPAPELPADESDKKPGVDPPGDELDKKPGVDPKAAEKNILEPDQKRAALPGIRQDAVKAFRRELDPTIWLEMVETAKDHYVPFTRLDKEEAKKLLPKKVFVPLPSYLAARQGIDAMYPPGQPLKDNARQRWGGILDQYESEQDALRGRVLRWGEVTEKTPWTGGVDPEKAMWYSWLRLTSNRGQAAQDLSRLGLVAREAYPDPADYEAALGWARRYYSHYHPQYKAPAARKIRGPDDKIDFKPMWDSKLMRDDDERLPQTDATLWWLVYRHVGLNEASRRTARDHWLKYFGPGKEALVLQWGRKLEAERRRAGEPLPPTSENVALLCAIERLTGTDAHGVRCRRIVMDSRKEIDDTLHPVAAGVINFGTWYSVRLAYPRQDLFYLTFGARDPLQQCSARDAVSSYTNMVIRDDRLEWLESWWLSLVIGGLLLMLVAWGLRSLTFSLIAGLVCVLGWPIALILGRSGGWTLRYGAYWCSQHRLQYKGILLSYVVAPLLTWGNVWRTLDGPINLLMPDAWHFLAGVFASVWLGGTIVLFINRFVALVLIRLGWSMETGWLDKILGSFAGGALLYHFGNDLWSVAGYVAFAVLPELFRRRLFSKRPAVESSSAPAEGS